MAVHARHEHLTDWNGRCGAVDTHFIGVFSRRGPSGTIKPDLVAPGSRSYGWKSTTAGSGANCPADCASTLLPSQFAWSFGTSFAAPVVTGIATWMKEYLRATNRAANPSPALLKSWLIAGSNMQAFQGQSSPPPSNVYGWGGASFESIVDSVPCNSYMIDQTAVLTPQATSWSANLTVVDFAKPVVIALVWTDRSGQGLKNDLMVQAQIVRTQWYGNDFEGGYSVPRVWCGFCNPPVPDHTNNVEKIVIDPGHLFDGNLTVNVFAEGLTTNGLSIGPTTPIQQDFALVVLNARGPCRQ